MLGPLGLEDLLMTVVTVLLVMVSASIHEFGHAWAAHRLGDDTAKRAGRLTPNPLAHIDSFGSIVLPLLMRLAGGPVFAFAKPVPYNPRNLRHPVRDEVLVALAGPATNLIQAGIGAAVCRLLLDGMLAGSVPVEVTYWGYRLLATYVLVNCTLAFFNLIPVPPLDGSAIVFPLLKGEARRNYYLVQHYAMPILMVLLYVMPMVLHLDPVGSWLDLTAQPVAALLLGWS